jgi:signal transduction histidine kinase
MRFRGKSIRRKIVVLLLVPLFSLVSIWAFASYITGREALQLIGIANISHKVGDPTVDTVHALQQERREQLISLADPRDSATQDRLKKRQRDTDREIKQLRDSASGGELRAKLTDDSRARLLGMLDQLAQVKKTRSQTADHTLHRGGAYQAYNTAVDTCFAFLRTLHGVDDRDLDNQSRALAGLDYAREDLSREDALMAAALASGEMTKGDQRAFSDRVAERNLIYDSTFGDLPSDERQRYDGYWDGTEGRNLLSYENAIIASGGRAADGVVDPDRWDAVTSAVLSDLKRLDSQAYQRYQQRVEPVATTVLVRAAAAGVLGAVAVFATLVISLRVGRSLVRDLRTLRKEAHEAAGVRLPSVMRRLAAGEQVDVETEAPRLEYGPEEMGQVGQALNTLQRAAVEGAVKQADLRRGVSEVFVNLARRNQVLLHRQLSLLDTMERRTEDSDELADLFRLDHLTTRMRRHAEGLVILSGAAPSRQWRKPVQLMDVVRAAVAEVEDYERIEVRRLSRLAVDGGAVADLTHLIAELLENATVFSPPHTAVQVLGERVTNGFTLEIHDRGLGMTADALLDANLRLAETPEFELSDTDRLGLFVVSRLAQRQGARVSLQHSPYGGTTAVVLIPGSLLTETPGADTEGGGTGRDRARRDNLASHSSAKGPSALSKGPRPALDGPVELEAPAGELDEGENGASLNGVNGANGARDAAGPRRPRPAPTGPVPHLPPQDGGGGDRGEDHQRTRDEAGTSRASGTGDGTGRAPLPRRRPRSPVLVSDHGRTVSPGPEPTRERDDGGPVQDRGTQTSGEGPRNSAGTVPDGAATDGTATDGTVTDGTATDGAATDRTPRDRAAADELAGTAGEQRTAGTVGGLPRRVRQASLAPQLRTDTRESPTTGRGGLGGRGHRGGRGDDGGGGSPAGSGRLWDRDADEVRSRMASLQRGWQRGRQHNAESDDDASGTAQGTTPEGDGR